MALPVLAGMFVGGLVSAAGSMAGRALMALGIGYVSYKGMDVLLDGIKSIVVSNFSGAGTEVLGVLTLLKIGESVNITFSAISAKFAIGGMRSGVIKKMAVK